MSTPRNVNEDPALLNGLATDIIIPVMGPTKSGKSSLLNRLLEGTDHAPELFPVGMKLASCTKAIGCRVVSRAPETNTALNRELDGRRIVLVDTPGFDDTYEDDEEILRRISEWLTASYQKDMLVAGVLYLHDISRDGFPESSLKNLKLFFKLCGADAMDQVAFATTKWDRLRDINEGMDRVLELRADFWRDMIESGAIVAHVQPKDVGPFLSRHHKTPWDIIYGIVRSADARDVRRRILQIQDEIINRKRFLAETDAGRELRMALEHLLEATKTLRRQEREDVKAGRGLATVTLEQRQEEIDKINQQLKAMQLPGIHTRARRWLTLKLRD